MIDLRPLIDLSFWFDLSPTTFSPGIDRGMFLFFGLIVIFGAASRIIARNRKEDRYMVKAYKMISQMLLTMGTLGLVLFFFTYEEIYLLGARFWFIIWAIGIIAWVGFIIRYVKVTIPALRFVAETKNKENEYLPRKNKR